MYNWIDDRRSSTPKNFPSFGYIPKNLNSFVRSKSTHWGHFNQLPVIKEEEGNPSDEEIELKNFLIQTPRINESYLGKKTSNLIGNGVSRKKEPVGKEWEVGSKSLTKLPPLVNINCMMNCDVKQSQQIWDTSFGKRLIKAKDLKGELKFQKIKETPPAKIEPVRKRSAKSGNNELFPSNRPTVTKRISIQERSNKNGGGDRENNFSKLKNDKKKCKKVDKDVRNPNAKGSGSEKKQVKSNTEIKSTNANEKYPDISGVQIFDTNLTPTVSSISRNQHFLTECVKSILDTVPDEISCEYCEETFPVVEDLRRHMKKHEEKKETCLLCGKVFYKPNDFIQHLLSHEGVDKFSCKKCKKYFPNLKKYQQHYKEIHFLPSETSTSQLNVEYVKKWLQKYECKRCKIAFDSEEAQRAHKKNHIKMDLTGAYLLSPKTI